MIEATPVWGETTDSESDGCRRCGCRVGRARPGRFSWGSLAVSGTYFASHLEFLLNNAYALLATALELARKWTGRALRWARCPARSGPRT